jgi:hypothetical protein
MCPSPIYPQFPHLHNHGLAMLARITPFWNMCPPLVYSSHLKRSFEEVIFSSNIIKTPSPQEMEQKKKKKKRGEEKKKLQESLQIKGKLIF